MQQDNQAPSTVLAKRESSGKAELRGSQSEPSLSGPTDIPGTRPSKRSHKSRKRRPSSQVLEEARGLAWEGLALDEESWGKLKEGLKAIPKVDHWMAGRSDKVLPDGRSRETTLYVSTRWARDKKVMAPIKALLPNQTLPNPSRDTEFLRKWLQTWVTVGESADLYTQRLQRPGRPPQRERAAIDAFLQPTKQPESLSNSRPKLATPAGEKVHPGVKVGSLSATYTGPEKDVLQ